MFISPGFSSDNIVTSGTDVPSSTSGVFATTSDGSITFTANKTGVFSTLTFDLLISDGRTWATLATWDAKTNGTSIYQLSSKNLYQLICTAFADGASVTVTASLPATNVAAPPAALVGIDGMQIAIANPLSVELSDGAQVIGVTGNPLKTDGSAVTQPVSGTFFQATQPVSGTVTANQGTITNTSPSPFTFTAHDVDSSSTAGFFAQNIITGTPTAGSAAVFALSSGFNAVCVQITGPAAFQLVPEGSIDGGVTWVSQSLVTRDANGQMFTYGGIITQGSFIGYVNVAGLTHFRMRATAGAGSGQTCLIVETINDAIADVSGAVTISDRSTASFRASVSSLGALRVDGSTALSVKSASGLTNAAVAIKASSGAIYGWFLDNTENSATTFFQFFNLAAGSVVVGTTTPLFSLAIPAGASANVSGLNVTFGAAISIAATTGYSNGAAPANAVTFTAFYV